MGYGWIHNCGDVFLLLGDCFSEHSSSAAIIKPLKLITEEIARCPDGPMTSAEIEWFRFCFCCEGRQRMMWI